MILDHSDAFNEIPSISVYGMGFKGEVFPERLWPQSLTLVQVGASHASPRTTRRQQFVDDPIMTAQGDLASTAETFDITILFWLLLGANLSWKGVGQPPKTSMSGLVPRSKRSMETQP